MAKPAGQGQGGPNIKRGKLTRAQIAAATDYLALVNLLRSNDPGVSPEDADRFARKTLKRREESAELARPPPAGD